MDCTATPIPLRMRLKGDATPEVTRWTCPGCDTTYVGPGERCPRGCKGDLADVVTGPWCEEGAA